VQPTLARCEGGIEARSARALPSPGGTIPMAESAESAGSAAAADKPRKRVPPAGFTLRGRKSTDSLPNLSLGRSPSKEELLSTASPAAVSLAGHRLSLDGSERDEPTNATSQGPPDSGTPPSPFTASRMRNSATAAAAPAPPPGLQGVAPPPPPPAPPPRVGGQSDGLVAPRRRTFSSSPEEILSGMPEQRRAGGAGPPRGAGPARLSPMARYG
jgi:hypothetical protein